MDDMKCALCWSDIGVKPHKFRPILLCCACMEMLEERNVVMEPYRRQRVINADDMDYWKMKWGKHQGVNFGDVPVSYCTWYLNKKQDEKPSDAFHVYCILNYSPLLKNPEN